MTFHGGIRPSWISRIRCDGRGPFRSRTLSASSQKVQPGRFCVFSSEVGRIVCGPGKGGVVSAILAESTSVSAMPFAAPGVVTVVDRVLFVCITLAAWPCAPIFLGGRYAIVPRAIIPRARMVIIKVSFPREIWHGELTYRRHWGDALQVTPTAK